MNGPLPALTPANLSAAAPASKSSLDVDDIQGDVLIGLQKNVEIFQYFTIGDVAAFKLVLRSEVLKRLTSTRLTIAREFQLRDAKAAPADVSAGDPKALPIIGMNIAFTSSGIGKLAPKVDLGDDSFTQGAAASAEGLGDPMTSAGKPDWLPKYTTGLIDGVFLITAGTLTDAQDALASLASALKPEIGPAAVTLLDPDVGEVRKGVNRGHEHFGFLDGVSQPAIAGLGTPFPGQRTIDTGYFVFGYGVTETLDLPWMRNGSFMVLRRLKQFVPEFSSTLDSEGSRLGMDGELLGARMMGRWQSGAQVADTPLQDDAELGSDPFKNNDFDFGDDPNQRGCPYGAHIRKVNPRDDLPDADVDVRRIMRQGIPFGPDVSPEEDADGKTSQDRGLMFVCYQTSIANQFEFLQKSWANNVGFVFGKTRPSDGSAVNPGYDPIIGQNPNGRARSTDEAIPNFPRGNERSAFNQPADAVVPEGGVYFFVPSISAIAATLS